MCGDMNGGGDQHVDFDKLVANKTREKSEAMERQRALLASRYDLTDRPSSVKRIARRRRLFGSGTRSM